MTARKTRPRRGDPITEDMSRRDVSAALGISKSELSRWARLASLPRQVFEERLAEQISGIPRGHRVTAESLIRGAPVPARGRVDRAKALYRGMTIPERYAFLEWVRALGTR